MPEGALDGVLLTSARALDGAAVVRQKIGSQSLDDPLSLSLSKAAHLRAPCFDRLSASGSKNVRHTPAQLPAYTVGPATSAAARAAGFADVREGPGGGGQALLDGLAGAGRLLWLAAEERTALVPPARVTLVPVVAYAMDFALLSDEAGAALAAGAVDWALLTSARAARRFAGEVDRLGVPRARVKVGAISAAVLAAAGKGWRAGVAAPEANEAALLSALAL